MNKTQIVKTLRVENIDLTHIEINKNQVEIFIEDANFPGTADEDATNKLMERVSDVLGWGGYQSGYGSWVLGIYDSAYNR